MAKQKRERPLSKKEKNTDLLYFFSGLNNVFSKHDNEYKPWEQQKQQTLNPSRIIYGLK